MAIQDRDISRAIDIISSEIENMEDVMEKLADSNKELGDENDGLRVRISELEEEVKSLEDALAEAYLTSETDDETLLDRRYPRKIGSSDETME